MVKRSAATKARAKRLPYPHSNNLGSLVLLFPIQTRASFDVWPLHLCRRTRPRRHLSFDADSPLQQSLRHAWISTAPAWISAATSWISAAVAGAGEEEEGERSLHAGSASVEKKGPGAGLHTIGEKVGVGHRVHGGEEEGRRQPLRSNEENASCWRCGARCERRGEWRARKGEAGRV